MRYLALIFPNLKKIVHISESIFSDCINTPISGLEISILQIKDAQHPCEILNAVSYQLIMIV